MHLVCAHGMHLLLLSQQLWCQTSRRHTGLPVLLLHQARSTSSSSSSNNHSQEVARERLSTGLWFPR